MFGLQVVNPFGGEAGEEFTNVLRTIAPHFKGELYGADEDDGAEHEMWVFPEKQDRRRVRLMLMAFADPCTVEFEEVELV